MQTIELSFQPAQNQLNWSLISKLEKFFKLVRKGWQVLHLAWALHKCRHLDARLTPTRPLGMRGWSLALVQCETLICWAQTQDLHAALCPIRASCVASSSARHLCWCKCQYEAPFYGVRVEIGKSIKYESCINWIIFQTRSESTHLKFWIKIYDIK